MNFSESHSNHFEYVKNFLTKTNRIIAQWGHLNGDTSHRNVLKKQTERTEKPIFDGERESVLYTFIWTWCDDIYRWVVSNDSIQGFIQFVPSLLSPHDHLNIHWALKTHLTTHSHKPQQPTHTEFKRIVTKSSCSLSKRYFSFSQISE